MRRSVLHLALALVAVIGLPTAPAGLPLAMAAPAAAESPDWAESPVRLLMVETPGCIYCAAWWREIGPGYPQSAEGKAAPLLTTDLDGPWPDGLALDRRPVITPTFILLKEGQELARLEGYPGDEFFYPLIGRMLAEAGLDPAHRKDDG